MKAKAKASKRPRRGLVYELARVLFYGFYRLKGWQVLGEAPRDKKLVIIAAPHETNWDLTQMLGIAFYYRIPVRWMGKSSLGTGPFGWLMRWWGLLPVDRDSSTNLVVQVAEAFDAAEEMAVVIAPEGTRSDVKAWKTGFYNIAMVANVPIALGFIDYQRKLGGVDGALIPTGSYHADMEKVAAHYAARVSRVNHPITGEPLGN
ncbi:1-acyl-sn-glycerol-3-phosphate acyltransferase [Hyphomonas sp. FCG-A18]|uniref:1-acyl-sn-glycerol-3-phosphate acyltransferase n=1 Tax=Hyphomonas sp. FCG-A18 TaxID=3080019 RepID=UPI002B2EE48A|nr:1-acyl-sn-glycerol-3-phosphate acyltransferase [Hyphomonas sp. FCG-A18]